MTAVVVTPFGQGARAGIPRFRRSAAAGDGIGAGAPFLAPAAEDLRPVTRAADRGETAMRRLCNPFAVMAGAAMPSGR